MSLERGHSDSSPRALPAFALLALGVGGFAVGTGEFVIVGLLPEVARGIGVSIPAAGHLISSYALGVVVGAPLLAVLGTRWRRRTLLIALMAFHAVANFATALATGALSVALTRFASGLPHGAYFGVAALAAAALAPRNRRARAVGFVMLGLTTAMLAGAPLATWLGQLLGWRAAYVFVGAMAVVAMVLIRYGVPDQPAEANASPLRELSALARPQVWITLAIAATGFGGMFCVFSYVKPTLIEVSGLGVAWVPLALSLFGMGGVEGNLIGARLADRALMRTIGGLLVYSAVVLAGSGTLAHHIWSALFGVFLLGSTIALGPALQVRLMDVAGDAQTLAAASNHSAFNVANALGAWIGGLAIGAGWGWTSLGWVGAVFAVTGLSIFGASLALAKYGSGPILMQHPASAR